MSQLPSDAQQRIFIYPSSEAVMNKGFDTVAPFMDYYPAPGTAAGKTAVLICPGGGYSHLAFDKEGVLPAKFFNENGIDAFVLRYRLNNAKQEGHRYPDQYNDVTRAMRIIRSRAGEFHIDPAKTGVMGFSAGGHLASTITTLLQEGDPAAADPLLRIATRPAFSILIYPVITMDTAFAHRGSRNMLLGPAPDESLVKALSTETRVTAATPPVFLVHSDDDKGVPPMNSIAFYTALKKNKVPATMYIYDHGGHGFGMAPADPLLSQWPTLCVQWLRRLGF
ncbi:alpha/beta hydrolase [Sediminibacterium soli]|uniref:alpha/beta hydrolase n=1 Tax=Sediminibacterium soli TaxID=2698829 RepID=UPI00137ACEB5|nr:alpha/beta hydrolase [Sediminibacterium soli]NCI47546.1 alpha/beta hydrolase [Sediminibacterium soli]